MKVRTFLICDDIRTELGNKYSLMGIYNERIIFGVSANEKNVWPRALKVGFFSEIEIDRKIPHTFTFKAVLNGEESEILKGGINIKKESRMIRMTLIHPGFVFKQAGTMKFKFEFFDESGKLIEAVTPDGDLSVEAKTTEEINSL